MECIKEMTKFSCSKGIEYGCPRVGNCDWQMHRITKNTFDYLLSDPQNFIDLASDIHLDSRVWYKREETRVYVYVCNQTFVKGLDKDQIEVDLDKLEDRI